MSLEELFDGMGNAPERAQRGARIPEGRTLLALREYGVTKSQTKGTVIFASFSVMKSDTMPEGTHVSQAWLVSKLGWQGEQELSRAQAFVKSLLGISDPKEAAKEGKKLCDAAQPGRGIQVWANGVKTQTGYVESNWEHVRQTGEDIVKVRGWIDQHAPLQERRPANTNQTPAAGTFGTPPGAGSAPAVGPTAAPGAPAGTGGLLASLGIGGVK